MFLSNAIKYYKYILATLRRDAVGAYSAQAALFLIISFFPFVMLLISLSQFILPWDEREMLEIITRFLPETISDWGRDIVLELYTKSSGALISVSAVTTLWAASKGVHVLIKGYDVVYEVENPRNYFWQRGISLLFTIVLLLAIIITVTLIIFGGTIYDFFLSAWPFLKDLKFIVNLVRSLIAPALLTVIFTALFTFFPRRKTKFRKELPGALFSAVGWWGFSYLFSFYIDNFSSFSYLYGSITAVVLFMLWMYVCMYITFIGAEINMFLRYGMIADVINEIKNKKK